MKLKHLLIFIIITSTGILLGELVSNIKPWDESIEHNIKTLVSKKDYTVIITGTTFADPYAYIYCEIKKDNIAIVPKHIILYTRLKIPLDDMLLIEKCQGQLLALVKASLPNKVLAIYDITEHLYWPYCNINTVHNNSNKTVIADKNMTGKYLLQKLKSANTGNDYILSEPILDEN